MEIYQLRAFVMAAHFGSLTRTAEALHLTQPAITAQIKALEEELGVALFDRRPGRISLTRAGQALLPSAQQVLAAAGQLQGKARELQGEITGQLILGTVGEADMLRLGSLLGALLQALPLMDIKTRGGLAEDLREQVGAGLLDGAFYIGPHIPRDVAGLPLQTLHYRVVAPVAQREALRHASWRELAAMPWIGAPVQHHTQTLRNDMFARQGLVPRQVVECSESTLPQSLVRAGVGLALLREDVAMPASERGELIVWPHVRVGAMLGFIHPHACEHDPAMVALLSILRQVWGVA